MKPKTKAILVLFFLSPILAELLSGSSPARTFFNPPFFLLQIISYGIPALVVREIAIRWNLRFSGMFVLAIGYGIFNEGLLAGTFFLVNASFFQSYGYYLGLNFAWIPFAAVWHSLHSIVYPILITSALFPSVAKEPWLSSRTTKILFALAALETGLLYFSQHSRPQGYFLILWFAIIILALIAKKYSGNLEFKPNKFSLGALAAGFLTVALYFVLIAITKTQITIFVYWIILIIFVKAFWWLIKKNHWHTMPLLISFAAGDYIGNGVFAIIGRGALPEVLATSIAVSAVLLYVAKKAASQSMSESNAQH
jgi:hypothetical protein